MQARSLMALVSALLPALVHAQVLGFGAGPGAEGRTPSDGSGGMVLQPFRYIEPNVAADAKTSEAAPRPPQQQALIDLNAKGDYATLGTQGLQVLAGGPVDDELQLIIANSLAWTGRVKEAIPIYQGLGQGPYANSATLGLANINRWNGRDDLALPLYQKVLAAEPENGDALAGVELAQRALAPKTTVRAGAATDSSDLKRRSGGIAHQWRGSGGSDIYEVEVGGFRDTSPTAQAVQQDVTLRYESLGLPLKPSLELNVTSKLNPSVYGVGKIKVLDDAVTLAAGRVNWGKSTANPLASINKLSANYLGVAATHSFSMGTVQAKADYFGISDGNAIVTTGVTFNSNWRPLGAHIKPFVGAETRTAKFNDPRYWSPIDGYGSAFAGLLGELGGDQWTLFGSVQVGVPIYGEAGNSWSVSAGGRVWVAKDVAVGANVWSMSSHRDNSAYRAKSADLFLEKIWP